MGNIMIGLIFIVGGLSGELVLMGTNSPEALMGVGVGLLVWGGVQLSRGR